MDGRGPAQVRAGDAGDGAAGHARPPGGHDRQDRSAVAGGTAAGLVDPRHAPGLVARRPRRPRLAAAAARLAAAPDRVEPVHGLAAAGGAGPGAAVLVACRRLAAGRKRRPTAAIIDTQSVKTGPQSGPRGYDAHKKIKGRKRVLMIDTQGDPLGVRVVPADIQDRDTLRTLAPDLDLPCLPPPGLARPRLRRRRSVRFPSASRHRRRDRRHPGPQGLPGRAPPLEGRADLRLPAALPAPARRRRDEPRHLARHDHARLGVHDRHAPRTHAPALRISGRPKDMARRCGLHPCRSSCPRGARNHSFCTKWLAYAGVLFATFLGVLRPLGIRMVW